MRYYWMNLKQEGFHPITVMMLTNKSVFTEFSDIPTVGS